MKRTISGQMNRGRRIPANYQQKEKIALPNIDLNFTEIVRPFLSSAASWLLGLGVFFSSRNCYYSKPSSGIGGRGGGGDGIDEGRRLVRDGLTSRDDRSRIS